jgi:hypothetical protein
MTFEEFTAELEAKLASMSKTELTDALLRAGFEAEDPSWPDVFWSVAGNQDFNPSCGYPAANSNELALAA